MVSLIRTLKSDIPSGANGSARPDIAENVPNVSGMELRAEPPPLISDPDPQLMDNFGRISLENAETSYVDGGHWKAILDGVYSNFFIRLHRLYFH